jgi:patatin-like phospholipase/acyl hydrolase
VMQSKVMSLAMTHEEKMIREAYMNGGSPILTKNLMNSKHHSPSKNFENGSRSKLHHYSADKSMMDQSMNNSSKWIEIIKKKEQNLQSRHKQLKE